MVERATYIARTDLTYPTLRLSIYFFAKWVIFSIVADAALLSRRADTYHKFGWPWCQRHEPLRAATLPTCKRKS